MNIQVGIQFNVTAKKCFVFHSFYKLMDVIYTESDIIPHLQDKTMLRKEWNSTAAGTEPVNL